LEIISSWGGVMSVKLRDTELTSLAEDIANDISDYQTIINFILTIDASINDDDFTMRLRDELRYAMHDRYERSELERINNKNLPIKAN
jgi:hypothetical protein